MTNIPVDAVGEIAIGARFHQAGELHEIVGTYDFKTHEEQGVSWINLTFADGTPIHHWQIFRPDDEGPRKVVLCTRKCDS